MSVFLTICIYFSLYSPAVFAQNTVPANTQECFMQTLKEVMNRGRGLAAYDHELGDYQGYVEKMKGIDRQYYVSTQLASLPSSSIWMDVGPGNAVVQQDVLSQPEFNHLRNMVGVDQHFTSEAEQVSAESQGRFHYQHGETLSDTIRLGKLSPWLGKVDYLTDLWSAASYTPDLRGILSDELKLLKVGGKAQINIHLGGSSRANLYNSLRFQLKSDPNYLTMHDGEVPLRNWLGRIKGVKVTVIGRSMNNDTGLMLMIEKTAEKPVLPKLKLISYDTSRKPPIRIYEDPNQ